MPNFGIIAEGPTDQVIIDNILSGYFGDHDQEPVVNPIQPPIPLGANPGGWDQVFKCLQRKDHELALQFNDFIIIHIDTDVQEESGFDVPRRIDNRELSVLERIDKVIQRLKREMDAHFFEANGDKIIFAIAVDSIECWLLPLYHPENPEKIPNCIDTVNKSLRKANKNALSAGKTKYVRAYEDASSPYRKRKILVSSVVKNTSFNRFFESLNRAIDLFTINSTNDSPPKLYE